jgi:iron complex outermembrane receptor protein
MYSFKDNKAIFTTLMASAVSTATIFPSIALAQEGDAGIEQIIVTARKSQETLQDIPLSVAAFDRTLIERYDISDLSDIAQRTPNFSFSNNLGVSGGVPVIRGIGTPRSGGSSSVGIFIDGVDTSNSAGINIQSFDIERIEVVRGPQSTLFGRGVLAGAINYIARRPNFNDAEREASAEIAEYGQYRAEVRASVPLNQDLAFSIAAQLRGFDGFYNEARTGEDTGNSSSRAVVAGLRARLGGNGEAFLRLSYDTQNVGQPSWHQVPTNYKSGATDAQRWYKGKLIGDPSKLEHNGADYRGLEMEHFRASLHLDYDLGGVSLSSISSYANANSLSDSDTDFTAQPDLLSGGVLLGNFRSIYDTKTESYSQELRLQSDGRGPVNWLLGAFYRNEKYELADFTPTAATGTSSRRADDPAYLTRDTKSLGLFGMVSLELADGLTISQELRYSQDQIDETSTPAGGTKGIFGDKFTNFLPRTIVEYQVSPDHMIYASAAKGNKPGGFNNSAGAGFSAVPNHLKPFDEESLWNYEAGVKTSWFDNKFTFNASVFYIDWTNVQVSTSVEVDGRNVSYTANAGKADGLGFETEFRVRPNSNIDIFGGFGYSPLRIIDYVDKRAVSAGLPARERSQVAGTPDWTANIGSVYTVPVGDNASVFLQGDVVYRSTTYATEANLAETGAKTTVGMQLGYRAGGLRAGLFVNNLFDDKTAASARAYVDPTSYARSFIVQLPERRQIGARVSVKY